MVAMLTDEAIKDKLEIAILALSTFRGNGSIPIASAQINANIATAASSLIIASSLIEINQTLKEIKILMEKKNSNVIP